MALDMFHANEMARAVRLLCQSGVELKADLVGGETLTVGSNMLFSLGDAIEVLDDDTAPVGGTVAQKTGLNQLRLMAPVTGSFQVAKNAWVRLAVPRLSGLKFVAQGRPDILPEPRSEQFPCIIVQPGVMTQPTNEGTNKAFQQDYLFHVYYARKRAAEEAVSVSLMAEGGKLFNLLMEDTYLGGTAWYSQVTRVDPNNPFDAELRARRAGVEVVQLDVLARRLEEWGK